MTVRPSFAERERSVRGILHVSLEDVRKVSDEIARYLRAEDRSEEKLVLINISYRNGDTIKIDDVNGISDLPDKKSNPIEKLSIGRISYRERGSQVDFFSQPFDWRACRITVVGSSEESQTFIDQLHDLLQKEKDISIVAPSHFKKLVLLLLILLYWQTYLTVSSLIEDTAASIGIISSLFGLFLFGYFLLIHIVESLIKKHIGLSIFDWGNNSIRSRNNLRIVNFLAFTVPFGIGMGILINKFS